MSKVTMADATQSSVPDDDGKIVHTDDSEATLPNTISTFIFEEMRRTYPWMELNAVRGTAERAAKFVNETVTEQTPKMAAARSRTGFMSLSAELRNRIYELALFCPDVDTNFVDPRNQADFESIGPMAFYGKPSICIQQAHICFAQDGGGGYNFFGWNCTMREQPALTKVSRQVRNESLPVYYGINDFVAYGDGDWATDSACNTSKLNGFLTAIGNKNCALIRRLTFLAVDPPEEIDVGKQAIMQDIKAEERGIEPTAVKLFRHTDSTMEEECFVEVTEDDEVNEDDQDDDDVLI